MVRSVLFILFLLQPFFSNHSVAGPAAKSGKVLPKIVYITIDDGPISGTKNLVKIADQLQVLFTMLLVGHQVETSKEHQAWLELARKSKWIELGNHSYWHAHDRYHYSYEHPSAMVADIQRNETFLQLSEKIVRLPGRNVWSVGGRTRYDLEDAKATADMLTKDGYAIFGWDCEWSHDSATGEPIQSVEEMVSIVEHQREHAFTKGHVVLLTHDEMFQTKPEDIKLVELVNALRKKGYQFRMLSQYPQSAI